MFESLEKGKASSFAKIIFHSINDIYGYAENDIWYKFENHRWNIIKNKNHKLRNMIDDVLYPFYEIMYSYYRDNGNDIKKLTKIKNIKNSFGDTTIKNNIITELIELYALQNDGKFLEKLDDDPYLLGFENGIYDLKNMEFRSGKPDDFVSLSVKYNFVDTYSDRIDNIKNYFISIMPEEEDREYLLTLLGSCLIGINSEEIYSIFTGGMRNGKSTLSNILMLVLGDYYGDIANTLLTKERPSADKPQPELLEIAKKRLIISSENEGNQKINTGFIKQITGNDRVKARALYSNNVITYIPHFKIISLFNDLPEVDKPNDLAFWGRCKCLHFKIKFTDNPVDINEKKINRNLKEEIKLWKQDCFLLLLEYCKKYMFSGLKYPKQVSDVTKKFEKNNNPYITYQENFIQKQEGSIIKWVDLKQDFTDWYKENVGSDVPKAKDIKNFFETKIFKEPERVIWLDNSKKACRGWKDWLNVNIDLE